jgi:aryl-alcohol dehydrogenase (NADP+)
MQYVNLGRAGIRVSRICLGSASFGNDEPWKVELEQARRIVKKALDLGINFFDTANVYASGQAEKILGNCLKDQRNDVVIATKVFGPMGSGPNDAGLSRRHILHEVRHSLKRLHTDYIDLYQIHRWDYATPIEETMRALNDVIRLGQAYYVGASSMLAWQFLKSLHTSEILGLEKFVSMQNHYNLVYREEEREMIPLCKQEVIALIPWSPLARGFLTGKYKRGKKPDSPRYQSDVPLRERYFKPEDFDILETVEQLAKEKGVTPSQIALAWLLHKGVTAPIIGATRIEHVEEAVESTNVNLNSGEMERLEVGYKPHVAMGLD